MRTFGENYYMTSNARFFFTSDNRFIIFNCGSDDTWKNFLGPVEAVFVYDTRSKEISRLSPKGMYAFDLNIENDESVIFAGSTENENHSNIYRVNLASKNLELIIKNGTRPTMRKK
jgi:hypothetical protein